LVRLGNTRTIDAAVRTPISVARPQMFFHMFFPALLSSLPDLFLAGLRFGGGRLLA
jgi:hypothetical protein